MRRCGRLGSPWSFWRRGTCATRSRSCPIKTDRQDARGIAQLMRLGWFRPVHCKSIEAQETRAMLTARKLVQKELLETESSLPGILRGFGLKVGKTTPVGFEYQGACCRTSKPGGHYNCAAVRGRGAPPSVAMTSRGSCGQWRAPIRGRGC